MHATTACEALAKGVCLRVAYDGFFRIGEVHAVGISTAGHPVMRVWQVRGGSVHGQPVGWKLLRLDEATGVALTDEPSGAPRPRYRRGDREMATIICQV